MNGIAGKTSSALATWGPPLVQGLLTIAVFFLGYWLNGQAQAQATFNARLSSVEQAQINTQSDVRNINTTIAASRAARDQQFENVTGQVSSQGARIDRVETAIDDKLDKLSSDVAGLLALAHRNEP